MMKNNQKPRMVLLRKNKQGRGHSRCWHGFIFDCVDQGDVEDFVIVIGEKYDDFLWLEETDLTKDTIVPHTYIYQGTWINMASVKVKRLKTRRQFIIQ